MIDYRRAAGEVGLLDEEAAQRLVAIFSEAAHKCLQHIAELSEQHGSGKFDALFCVGLDLVKRWEADVLAEEVGRLEFAYPELQELHSYCCLWLVDHLLAGALVPATAWPVLTQCYASFMRRVAMHPEVRRGSTFLAAPQLQRRAIYVEAFRGAYHDNFGASRAAAREARLEHAREERQSVLDLPSPKSSRASSAPQQSPSKGSKSNASGSIVEDEPQPSKGSKSNASGSSIVEEIVIVPRCTELSSRSDRSALESLSSHRTAASAKTKAVTVATANFFDGVDVPVPEDD